MQIRVNVSYFYALWTQKDICLNSFWRLIFFFKFMHFSCDAVICIHDYIRGSQSDHCLPTYFVRKFLRGSPYDFVVAKISCSKPALYFFKFINIGLVEKLIFLNKLITTRYIAKPSHCEFSWFDSIFRCAWLTVSRPSKTSSGMVVRPPLFHSSSDTVPSES